MIKMVASHHQINSFLLAKLAQFIPQRGLYHAYLIKSLNHAVLLIKTLL